MHKHSKKELRTHFLVLREQMDRSKKASRDAKICEHLCSLEQVCSASDLLLYAPFRNEIDLSTFFEHAKKEGKHTAFPKCQKNGIMQFHYADYSSLTPKAYGILEPDENSPLIDPNRKSICLLPCLAATKSGHRLGYGGGYYDRFLTNYTGTKIIAVYSDFILKNDHYKTDEFDIPADIIITEEGVIRL